MPAFVMKWPTSRTFPDLGVVESGEVIEADENPHPAFFDEQAPAVSETTTTPVEVSSSSEGA